MMASTPEPGTPLYDRILAADEYTLHNLIRHLLMAGDSSRAVRLVTGSPDWLRAKAKRLDGDRQYLDDVRLILESLREPNTPEALGDLLCLHAARTNVYRRASRFSYRALEALVWLGREAEALNQVRTQPTLVSGRALANVRANIRGAYTPQSDLLLGLLAVYRALRERDGRRTTDVCELEHEIERYVRGLENREDVLSALHATVPVLIQFGEYGLAESLLRSRLHDHTAQELLFNLLLASGQRGAAEALVHEQDSFHSDRWAPALARLLAERGDFEAARSTIDSIESKWRRPEAQLALVVTLARAQRFAEAEALLEQPISLAVVQAASDLAQTYVDLGEEDRARQLLRIASDAVDHIPAFGPNIDDESAEERRVVALSDLARIWASLGDGEATDACLERAAAYVAQIRWVYSARDAKALLLCTLVDLGRLAFALRLLDQPPLVAEEWLKATVAGRLAEQGQVSTAQDLAARLAAPGLRSEAGLAVSLALARAGQRAEAGEAFDRALQDSAAEEGSSPAFIRRVCALARRFETRRATVAVWLVAFADGQARGLVDDDNALAEGLASDRETLEMPGDERELRYGDVLGDVALGWLSLGDWEKALALIRHGLPRQARQLDLEDRQRVLRLLRSVHERVTLEDGRDLLTFFGIELEPAVALDADPGRRLATLEAAFATLDRERDDESFYTTLAEIVIELTDQQRWLEAERQLEAFNLEIVYPSSRFPEFMRSLHYWLEHLCAQADDTHVEEVLERHRDDEEWGVSVELVQVGRYARAGAVDRLRRLLGEDPSERLLVEAVTQAAASSHRPLAEALYGDLKAKLRDSSSYDRDRYALDACLAMLSASARRGDGEAVAGYLSEAQAIVRDAESGRSDSLGKKLPCELARMGLIAEALDRLGEESGEISLIDLVLEADAVLAPTGNGIDPEQQGGVLGRVLSVYAWEHTEWRAVVAALAAENV